MVLHVSFEEFVEATKRVLGSREAYLTPSGEGVVLTAAHPTQDRIVMAQTQLSMGEVKKKLNGCGLELHDGAWAKDVDEPHGQNLLQTVHLGAVSYLSGARQPGIWVDAFDTKPTTVQVLRTMYEEFRSTGEMPDVSFEEFVRMANPNVAILSPDELEGFIEAKIREC